MRIEEVQKLINSTAPKAIKKLGLSTYSIKWNLVDSTTEEGKKMMGQTELVGYCIRDKAKKKASITLFYNEMASKKICKATIIHELLHVRFYVFYAHCKKNKINHMHRNEEKFILDLEKYIVANF